MYQARQEVYNAEFEKNKWVNPFLLNNNLNKHLDTRTIAEFYLNEIVGFEEIIQ